MGSGTRVIQRVAVTQGCQDTSLLMVVVAVPGMGSCLSTEMCTTSGCSPPVHLGKPALLQVITRLRSCVVQSYFPSLQVNKAFKSTVKQPLFLPHVPGLSLINPIPGEWNAVLFSAF